MAADSDPAEVAGAPGGDRQWARALPEARRHRRPQVEEARHQARVARTPHAVSEAHEAAEELIHVLPTGSLATCLSSLRFPRHYLH